MERKIISFTHTWAEKLGVEVKKITFRKYNRTYGKAFKNRKEIFYDKDVTQHLTRKEQNYLALHEVAHLVAARTHSKEWKMLMTMHMSKWKEIRAKLGKRRIRSMTTFRAKTEVRLRKMQKDSIKKLLRNPKTSTHVKHIAKEILSEKI